MLTDRSNRSRASSESSSRNDRYRTRWGKRNKSTCSGLRPMGLLDIITGEMLLVPGVEAFDSGRDDVELRGGGKAFAHIHRPDRIDVRLPLDLKEKILRRGIASAPPHPRDTAG